MADGGWIKLYRKIMTSFVWSDANQLKLWLLCLMKASHEERRFVFNGEEVNVSSGQFVTGRDALASEYNAGVKRGQLIVSRTLWRWIKKFESSEMLSIASTTKYSVITIKNWGEYQEGVQQLSSGRPSSVQHLSTYKKDKNEKKDKNTTTTDPFDFYQQNGFGMISGFVGEDMNQWIGDFQQAGASEQEASAIIVKSLQIAVERGKTNWGYAKAILKDWDQHGLHSIEAIDAAQAKHNANRQSRKSSSKSSPDVYRNHDFTDEDAKW
jgi:DnaD/phage-associated family protein